jgi:hypothetical protein
VLGGGRDLETLRAADHLVERVEAEFGQLGAEEFGFATARRRPWSNRNSA